VRLPLSVAAFDRAAQHRDDPVWLEAAWRHGRVLCISAKSATPVRPDGAGLALRRAGDVPPDVPRRFLGIAGELPYFAVTTEPGGEQSSTEPGGEQSSTEPGGEQSSTERWLTLREIGLQVDDLAAGLLTAAIGLEQWHQRHGHCARCGAATVEAAAGWTRVCPVDASEHFPRTDPAVIMLICDDADRVLLGNGAGWAPGRYSTLAGFVEPGESLEAAVAREVFEEVGVGVRDMRYVASQPWPFPSSLMVGFVGRLDGDARLQLDSKEIQHADWFTRQEVQRAAEWADGTGEPDPAATLRGVSPRLSISRYLIDQWLAGAIG
jgi:NAD+ diphosphatase